jgi:hypothetical protein
MSSAILYLAIIAIWACILIPRWLHRDTSRTASAREAAQELAAMSDPASESGTPDDAGKAEESDDTRDRGSAPVPASREEARRRVLAARRRMLWMLLALEAAGAGLTTTRLAAWWVLAPPTVMLIGYLLLLREAAATDSERAAAEHEAMRAQEARRRAIARARQAREREAVLRTATPNLPPLAYVAAPVAGDYEDLGRARDFTPGLRHAPSDDPAEDDAYDQYPHNRLRAVGD